MGRRGDRRPKEVMDPGCPSDKRNLRNRLWQAGRDNDADHNGTSSQLPKDLGRVPAAFACSGKAAAYDEYFELKADYEYAINALSGEIEVFEKSMDSLDNQLARYRAMEKDAKTLAQDHVLTAELIERLIERIEIDHERNIHVTFRFKNEFQGKAVELCATM